jgi:hypothetical protein
MRSLVPFAKYENMMEAAKICDNKTVMACTSEGVHVNETDCYRGQSYSDMGCGYPCLDRRFGTFFTTNRSSLGPCFMATTKHCQNTIWRSITWILSLAIGFDWLAWTGSPFLRFMVVIQNASYRTDCWLAICDGSSVVFVSRQALKARDAERSLTDPQTMSGKHSKRNLTEEEESISLNQWKSKPRKIVSDRSYDPPSVGPWNCPRCTFYNTVRIGSRSKCALLECCVQILVDFKLHDRGFQSIIYSMEIVLALYDVCMCSSLLAHRSSS